MVDAIVQNESISITPSTDGRVFLTVEIESSSIMPFINMLSSLESLFRIVNNRVRSIDAVLKLPSQRSVSSSAYDQYVSQVNETFEKINDRASLSNNQIISIVNRKVKQTYLNSTYDLVKQILTKSGRFRRSPKS